MNLEFGTSLSPASPRGDPGDKRERESWVIKRRYLSYYIYIMYIYIYGCDRGMMMTESGPSLKIN